MPLTKRVKQVHVPWAEPGTGFTAYAQSLDHYPDAQRMLFPAGREVPKPRMRRRSSEWEKGSHLKDLPAREPEAEPEE